MVIITDYCTYTRVTYHIIFVNAQNKYYEMNKNLKTLCRQFKFAKSFEVLFNFQTF